MSLVINHNMMAANTASNLNSHYEKLSVSTQRLSSGLRINSAADDAAGLAIRELQRTEIAALQQGSRNASDAISLIQTADGALGVIDEKLTRMKELAEQAATGTYDSTQRLMIESEFQAMASEIDRIAQATNFNGVNLLNASSNINTQKISTISYPQALPSTFSANLHSHWSMDGNSNDVTGNGNDGTDTNITYFGSPLKAAEFNGNDSSILINNYSIASQDVTVSAWVYLESYGTSSEHARQIISTSAADQGLQLEVWGDGTIMFDATTRNDSRLTSPPGVFNLNQWQLITATKLGSSSYIYVNGNLVANTTVGGSLNLNNEQLAIGYQVSRTDQTWDGAIEDVRIYTRGLTSDEAKTMYNAADTQNTNDSIKIHFGSGNDSAEDYYYIEKRDCTKKGLGIDGISIETQDKAQKSLQTIDNAIVKKDKTRSYYGALQNRLENTITNLNVQAENLQASESRISDVDVASEMTEFVRQQILAQSAVAMLSQANSMPKMAMQLISG